MRTPYAWALAAALPLLLSCDGGGDADGGPDTGPAPDCTALVPYADGDEGNATPLAVPAGEVRAGRLGAADLPVDRTGMGTWAAGDFVIANERFALLIEDVGASDLYDPYGGRPVGIARVEDGALVEAGDFNEVIFGYGGFLVVTETVTVLADGSDGGPAILRARGPMGTLEFAGELLSSVINTDDFTGMPGALDYELAPGSDSVRVTLRLQQNNPDAGPARTPLLLTGFFQRYRMPLWGRTSGFVIPAGDTPSVAFIDDEATSYAFLAPAGGALSPVLEISGVYAMSSGRGIVPTCTDGTIELGEILLGGPGLGGLQASFARRDGATLRSLSGTVSEADGSPARDVRVHVRDAEGVHFARVTPDEEGRYALEVPSAEVALTVFRQGQSLVGPVTVAAGASTQDLDMPEHGTIRVTVTNTAAEPAPIPSRVQVLPAGGAPSIPEDLGERAIESGRAHVEFAGTTPSVLRVDPGTHEVVVSRGFEYEIHRETITVAAGATVEVAAALERVVDTVNVQCADYHIHTWRSPDSPDAPEYKLRGAIADGVEIPVRSDHEWVNDFGTIIEDLGLSAFAHGVGGLELTTFAWGHFGVFPLVEDRGLRNGSAPEWVGRLPPAVFADVRARAEEPVLIINHPRNGGRLGGYFEAASLDRATGTAIHPEMWDEEFTLVEVFNDKSFDQALEDDVADWFALLGAGRRIFAVGSSDSHNIHGKPVGYPRTCLELGTDEPSALSDTMVRDATASGHSTISGGLYLTVTGPDGVGPGDEAMGVGDTASFDVIVQGACWISATALEVWVDGALHETLPIPATTPATCEAVRLRAEGATGIEVPVAATGSWVVFHARGEMDLTPVHPGRMPFAVSNPVFLQR